MPVYNMPQGYVICTHRALAHTVLYSTYGTGKHCQLCTCQCAADCACHCASSFVLYEVIPTMQEKDMEISYIPNHYTHCLIV